MVNMWFFGTKCFLDAEDPVLPFISASKYLAAEDGPILCCLFLDALMKVLVDPLHPKINFFLMQRITIEGFLIQYDPLHPMQYNDPLHPWVGSSASKGCGKKRDAGIHEIMLCNRVFRLPILKWASKASTATVAVS